MNYAHRLIAMAGAGALMLMAWTAPTRAQEKPAPTPVDGKIDWVYDYEEGKLLSRRLDKPMFVVLRCER